MPAALEVNRNEVEMNVRVYGVRETARMMGLNENTVLAWAHRGDWLGNIPRSSPLPPTVSRPTINAISGPKALAIAMAEDSQDCRATVLRVAKRALKRVERCDDDELLMPEIAGVLNQHTKTAALGGGWAAQSGVSLKIQLGAVGSEAITMEAELVEEASTDVADY